jgi:hypothetical protein
MLRSAAPPMLLAASTLIAAFWVAICAAAPEFIWQGLWLAGHHVTRTELLSALLVGFVLAFFVEPLMERLRGQRRGHSASRTSGTALFTAALSLVFALASIALHDAMTAFVSEHEQSVHGGLADAISLTMAWAIVPFAVTLAWVCLPNRWLAIPVAVIAAVSPCIAGWLFAWPLHSVFTTAVPSLVILGLGYHWTARRPHVSALRTTCAPSHGWPSSGCRWHCSSICCSAGSGWISSSCTVRSTSGWMPASIWDGAWVCCSHRHLTWPPQMGDPTESGRLQGTRATRRTPPRLPLSYSRAITV